MAELALLADLQQTLYPQSGHMPAAVSRVQERESLPARDRRSNHSNHQHKLDSNKKIRMSALIAK